MKGKFLSFKNRPPYFVAKLFSLCLTTFTIFCMHLFQLLHFTPNPNPRLPRINQTNGLLIRFHRFRFLSFTIQQLCHSVIVIDQLNLIGVVFVIEHLFKGFFRFFELITLDVSHAQVEIGFYRFFAAVCGAGCVCRFV